jgi:OPA family sugar phosphate sensor protein UhpC-like MFS transporter
LNYHIGIPYYKAMLYVNFRRIFLKYFFNIFKPARHIEPIQDPQRVDALYKYWRIRILYSMFFGYVFYYFTRKSFTFAMPGLIEDLHFDKVQLGLLGSILSIVYGISKFTSGVLSDRSNPRYFMAFGLVMTGVFNICFGLSSSFLFFALFWGLNGWFQACGWPPCARFLTHWYSQSERGSWWSTLNVSHNVGGGLSSWIVGACMALPPFLKGAKILPPELEEMLPSGWRLAMYVPGVLCIMGGIFLINRLRDTPQSLGLPPIEKFRNDYGSVKNQEDLERELSIRERLVEYVLKNPYIWLLAVAYFFVYVIRTGVNDWTALYLLESKGYESRLIANGTVSMFDVGGFCGCLVAGWASDKLFGAKRGPINVIFSLFAFCALLIFWFAPTGDTYGWVDAIAIALIGFSVFGPQMLIGVCAVEFSHKKAAATANGFVGCISYIGAAAAGYPLGKIIQEFGWDAFFLSLLICCVASALLLIPTWNIKEVQRKTKIKPVLATETVSE